MNLKTITSVVFGYPPRRTAKAEKKPVVKDETFEEQIIKKMEIPAPSVPVNISSDDKEKVAESLLTVIENGVEKGTVATVGSVPPQPAILKIGEPTVEVKKEVVSEAKEVKKEEVKEGKEVTAEKEKKSGGDMLSELFKQDEKKKDGPMEMLIASLADVNVQDLLNEVKELKTLMYQWQEKRKQALQVVSQETASAVLEPVAQGVGNGKKG